MIIIIVCEGADRPLCVEWALNPQGEPNMLLFLCFTVPQLVKDNMLSYNTL